MSQRDPVGLTEKQIAVLDLLAQHKSSKEIARTLGISPATVEQRLRAARQKLGVNDRRELAYAWLQRCGFDALAEPVGLPLLACDDGEGAEKKSFYKESQKVLYEKLHIQERPLPSHEGFSDAGLMFRVNDSRPYFEPAPWGLHEPPVSFAAEVLSGKKGVLYRLTAIAILALVLMITLLVGVAVMASLSDIKV